MKRTYFLVAVAIAQLFVGLVLMYGAASPVRLSGDVLIPAGAYHHIEFGISGAGRVLGNVTELQDRPVDLLVFDDRGYAAFRDGSNAVPPLFVRNGTEVVFSTDVPGWGAYHVVVVDFASRGERSVHLDVVIVGLKTAETIFGVVVIAGGLALVGASLMMSVWVTHRAPRIPDPTPVPQNASPNDPPDPADDNTRVY